MSQKFGNKYIPTYENLSLPWYELDSFLTYIGQLKYKEIIENLDKHFFKVKVINFDINHNECSGTPLENSVKH